MTTQVSAAIVISQATVSPPGGYVSGPRDDLVQGQTITLTNRIDTGVVSWQWEISPPLGRSLDDYGVTGLGTSTVTITPPADPDGAGDLFVRLTVLGSPLPSGQANRAVDEATLGIRLPSSLYSPGIPLPNSLEGEAGQKSALDPARGSKGRIIEAISAVAQISGALSRRQSHADALLWYKMGDAANYENSGTAGAADLLISGTARNQIPGPFGKASYLYDTTGFSGAASKTLAGDGDAATIWAWVVPNKEGFVWGRYKSSTGEKRFTLEISSGYAIATAKASSTKTVTSTRPVVAGQPNLLVAVYDPTDKETLQIYVNGIPDTDTPSDGTIQWIDETPGAVVWGGGYSAHTAACPGIYAELGGTNTALDASYIAEMWRRVIGWQS